MNSNVSPQALISSQYRKKLKAIVCSCENTNDLFGVLFEICFSSDIRADAYSCKDELEKKCNELTQFAEVYIFNKIKNSETQSMEIQSFNRVLFFDVIPELNGKVEILLNEHTQLNPKLFNQEINPFKTFLFCESNNFTYHEFNLCCRVLRHKDFVQIKPEPSEQVKKLALKAWKKSDDKKEAEPITSYIDDHGGNIREKWKLLQVLNPKARQVDLAFIIGTNASNINRALKK